MSAEAPVEVRVPPLYAVVIPPTRVFVRTLFTVLGGWRVEGREHLPETGGVLIASNHVSYADPPIIGLAAGRRCWFMAKEPLFRNPLFARLIRTYLAYPVRIDGAMDRAALRQTEALLEAGEAVCVYPEGHVPRDGQLHEFQSGLALLALRARVPVVPAAIIGAGKALPPPYCLPHFTRGGVTVRFGPPIPPAAFPAEGSRREQADRLTAQIREAVSALLGGRGSAA